MWPLWKAIKFIENNDTSMISIYPIFQQILYYWNDLSEYLKNKKENGQISENEYNRWNESINYLNKQLEFRMFHTFDWPTVATIMLFFSWWTDGFSTEIKKVRSNSFV